MPSSRDPRVDVLRVMAVAQNQEDTQGMEAGGVAALTAFLSTGLGGGAVI